MPVFARVLTLGFARVLTLGNSQRAMILLGNRVPRQGKAERRTCPPIQLKSQSDRRLTSVMIRSAVAPISLLSDG